LHITSVSVKVTVFCDLMPCSLAEICWCFGGTCCLSLHDRLSFAIIQRIVNM